MTRADWLKFVRATEWSWHSQECREEHQRTGDELYRELADSSKATSDHYYDRVRRPSLCMAWWAICMHHGVTGVA